jgi:hypothetical protein
MRVSAQLPPHLVFAFCGAHVLELFNFDGKLSVVWNSEHSRKALVINQTHDEVIVVYWVVCARCAIAKINTAVRPSASFSTWILLWYTKHYWKWTQQQSPRFASLPKVDIIAVHWSWSKHKAVYDLAYIHVCVWPSICPCQKVHMYPLCMHMYPLYTNSSEAHTLWCPPLELVLCTSWTEAWAPSPSFL